jgi:uncharacterized protein YaaQ
MVDHYEVSMFKLIVAIIRDSDANAVSDTLIAQNFRATRIASTGAFFRQGNTHSDYRR